METCYSIYRLDFREHSLALLYIESNRGSLIGTGVSTSFTMEVQKQKCALSLPCHYKAINPKQTFADIVVY
jgi:hypothetical protein